MSYKNEFKVIDTQQKAYFLGLLYADGCLSQIKTKTNYVKQQVQISLTDEELVRSLHEKFPFFNLQIFDFGKYKSTWSTQYALRKANKSLFQDLQSWGLSPQKSRSNLDKLSLPELQGPFISHFIRGVFDGDGSISIPKKRPNLRRVEICCASKLFLTHIKQVLEQNNISCPILRKKNNNKTPLFVLEWVNSRDIIALREYLYYEATIYLKRKKELFDSFKKIDKKEQNPLCIYCGGATRKRGSRTMKHRKMFRFSCTVCNKQFSIQAQIKSDKLLETPEVDNQQPITSLND